MVLTPTSLSRMSRMASRRREYGHPGMSERTGTGVSLRQSAVEPGFHGVPTCSARPARCPTGDIRLGGMVLQVHGRDIHAVWTAPAGRSWPDPLLPIGLIRNFRDAKHPRTESGHPHQAAARGLWRVRQFRSRPLTHEALRYWRIFVWSICARCDQVKVSA